MAHERGESGRRRIAGDRYATPPENTAALVIGLRRVGAILPQAILDPCGGGGQLARTFMALEPRAIVRLADLNPDQAAADLYSVMAPVDARDPDQLKMVLDATGARAIASNPPFSRLANPAIVQAGLSLLHERRIDFLALMATTSHAIDSDIGYRQTAVEKHFVGAIACCWRTVLFSTETTGKRAHAWLLWTATGRGRLGCYQTIPISRAEARAALAESDAGDPDETFEQLVGAEPIGADN